MAINHMNMFGVVELVIHIDKINNKLNKTI